MTPDEIQELLPRFAHFLRQFLFCCGYTQTFDLLGVYCRGLLSDLPRKTAEPIALAAGVAIRTVQEFLRDHVWHHEQVRDQLLDHVAATLQQLPPDSLGTLGILDETGTVKKGTHTPGVQRQWCGEVGKQENCIVTVHLGVAHGRYKTLIDADLFLPKSWNEDRERCREARIPDTLHYRSKWQIGLEQLDRARAHHIHLDWMTFDEYYGSKPGFLGGLETRRQRYVGEVPKSFRCFTRQPQQQQAGRRADNLVRHSPDFHRQPWQTVRLQRQTVGEQVWEAKVAPIWVSVQGRPAPQRCLLIWARNVNTGEEKYFVSNARLGTSLRTLLRVAFGRWNVEHCIRVSKSEIGFRHFEGRSYVALMRHLTLCVATQVFVAGETDRLRGEKSGGDDGASVPCVASTM
jgi:SRSO17 transposase